MRKKKSVTLEKVVKELIKSGAECLPLNDKTYIIFYTRIIFETINSESNIFQPTTQQQKIFIPSYFIISSNEEEKYDNLSATVFNIKNKTIFQRNFVSEEVIEFFNQNIF